MKIKYSEDIYIEKRVKRLKLTYILKELIFNLSILSIICFSVKLNHLFIGGILAFLICLAIEFIYYDYFSKVIDDSINKELNPKLFLNYSIFNSKRFLFKKEALMDIALAYIYMGEFKKSEEVIKYLENKKLTYEMKCLLLDRKITLYYFKNKEKELKNAKKDLLENISNISEDLKAQLLLNAELFEALIEKDKDVLASICLTLKEKNNNMDRAMYLYIKSLFFEEKGNKYQKKLAYEGGSLFFAKEERVDQSITTNNNLKSRRDKKALIILGTITIILIITSIIGIFLIIS